MTEQLGSTEPQPIIEMTATDYYIFHLRKAGLLQPDDIPNQVEDLVVLKEKGLFKPEQYYASGLLTLLIDRIVSNCPELTPDERMTFELYFHVYTKHFHMIKPSEFVAAIDCIIDTYYAKPVQFD